MTDEEKKWLWKNIDKMTKEEFNIFRKHINDIAVAENFLHQLYLSVKDRENEVAE